VTQDQWQDTLSDAAETHKYDLARKFHMHFVFAHNSCLILVFSLISFDSQVDARWADAASLPGGTNFSSFRKYFGRSRKNPRAASFGKRLWPVGGSARAVGRESLPATKNTVAGRLS
jgi:hypothetical protein